MYPFKLNRESFLVTTGEENWSSASRQTTILPAAAAAALIYDLMVRLTNGLVDIL